jgi:apolipoprotein N-acyltransferase
LRDKVLMGKQTINSMMSSLQTMPALLEHFTHSRLRTRLSLLDLVIVLTAGCAHAFSMAWPFAFGPKLGQTLWWLQLLSLATLVWQLNRCTRWRQGLLLGWLFATAGLCATWWWLYISLHVYGGLAAPLTVLAVGGLAIFLATYYAVASAMFVSLAPAGRTRRAIVFAALWLLAELARVEFFTGFPWGEAGYAHLSGWLADYARWIGVHGMTFLAAFIAASLASLGRTRRQLMMFALIVLLLAALAFVAGRPTSTSAGKIEVTLLQGNIPQDEKFQPGSGLPTALRWYGEQLQAAKTALVVAPETSLPLLPQQLPEGYWAALQARFASGQQAALIGIPLGSSGAGYANSVVGLQPGAKQAYRFDKHHLVPFGEFVPTGFRWFINMMNIPLGDFQRGKPGQATFDWQGQRLAPNICYEDLFGEELGASFADAATAPTVMVNVSNIGWFGNTVAIDQHLNISRMRTLEFERPMIRATNTGATVIIDHRGQVTHELPRHTRGVLVGEVEGRHGITPYAWWVARYGLWPLWGLALGIVMLAALLRRR